MGRSTREGGPVRETSTPEDQHLHLHYTKPSKLWSEALPVGNGRLGAMVHGRTTTELLQLNEDSVWYGGPQDRTPRDAYRNLPLLRQLIREGRHAEAEELVRTAFFASPASSKQLLDTIFTPSKKKPLLSAVCASKNLSGA